MRDIIPKTSENCAPLNGAPRWFGEICRPTHCLLFQGYIKEGRTLTGPNVRAHLTINLSKLSSAPGAVFCADICPASDQYEDRACRNSSSYRHHLTWRQWRINSLICVAYSMSDVGDYEHLMDLWICN